MTHCQDQLKAVLNSLHDTILIVDLEGGVLLGNEAFLKRIPFSPDGKEARRIFDYLIDSDKSKLLQAFHDVKFNNVLDIWLTWINVYPQDTGFTRLIYYEFNESPSIIIVLKRKELEESPNWILSGIIGQEIERERIARELQSSVMQDLHVIHMFLQSLGRMEFDSEEYKLCYTDVMGSVKTSIANLECVIDDLYPFFLIDKGLIKTFQDLLQSFKNTNSFELDFAVNGSIQTIENMNPQIKLHVYRIIQEYITINLKNFATKSLTLTLEVIQNIVRVTVLSEGDLLDSEKLINKKGFKGINDRVTSLHSNYSIVSLPNGGQFQFSIYAQ